MKERLFLDMELIFSFDNNGWYWLRFVGWKMSQVFKTETEALRAKEENRLIWNY